MCQKKSAKPFYGDYHIFCARKIEKKLNDVINIIRIEIATFLVSPSTTVHRTASRHNAF